MEFRIPLLRRQYSLDFATSINGDPYFYGAKFVEYHPDGSFHLHAELIADTVEGATNPLNRNSAAMVLLANNNVPGSVSVPSGGGGDEDDCSFMDVTVHSNAGSVGAAASPSTFAQQEGSTTMISPAGGVTVTPIVTKNHPLALFSSTDDAI
jgi:hypothetical protein